MSHCLVIKVLCFLSLRQLVYFITSFFVCQELFSNFFQTFSMFFQAIRSLVDSLFTLPHLQAVVNKFFIFLFFLKSGKIKVRFFFEADFSIAPISF